MPTSCKQTSRIQDRIIREIEALPDKPDSLFSDFEIGIIRKYYATKGTVQLAKVLGKTYHQIKGKAYRLGLSKVKGI